MDTEAMARRSGDAKWQLGEPWASKLADFCEAHYNAPAKEIMRRALDEFINARLDQEPEMRKRYEAAQKARVKGDGANLKVVRREDG